MISPTEVAVRGVECPFCLAPVGRGCRTTSGFGAPTRVHLARLRKARLLIKIVRESMRNPR